MASSSAAAVGGLSRQNISVVEEDEEKYCMKR